MFFITYRENQIIPTPPSPGNRKRLIILKLAAKVTGLRLGKIMICNFPIVSEKKFKSSGKSKNQIKGSTGLCFKRIK